MDSQQVTFYFPDGTELEADLDMLENFSYFKMLFKYYDNGSSKPHDIYMESADVPVFKCILDFIKDGECDISACHIVELFATVDMMGLTDMFSIISRDFREILYDFTVIDFLYYTFTKGFDELTVNALQKVFDDGMLINDNSSRNWNFYILRKVFTLEYLRYIYRSPMLRYFNVWSSECNKRKILITTVIRDIREKNACKSSIKELLEDIEKIIESKEYLMDLGPNRLSAIVVGGETRHEKFHYGGRRFATPSSEDNVTVVTHNEFHEDINSGYSTTKCIPNMLKARSGFASALDKNGFFVIGGKSRSGRILPSVEYYDYDDNEWSFSTPMNEPRTFCGATSMNGQVYVTGGITTDDKILASTCVYLTNESKWKVLDEMIQKRTYHKLCSINGLIYAIGGQSDRKVLSSVEVYDTFENCWRYVTSMNYARKRFGIGVVDSEIYVFGGLDNGEHSVECVEKYDTAQDIWTLIRVTTGIYDAAVTAFGNVIYICGGCAHNNHPQNLILNLRSDSHVIRVQSQTKIKRFAAVMYVLPDNKYLHDTLSAAERRTSMSNCPFL